MLDIEALAQAIIEATEKLLSDRETMEDVAQ